jgi:hypothetical protein
MGLKCFDLGGVESEHLDGEEGLEEVMRRLGLTEDDDVL